MGSPAVASTDQDNEESDNLRVRSSKPMSVHWLLKAANLNWTTKELKSAKSKLGQVGVVSYSDLEDVLKEKGTLNNRLRESGLKVFGAAPFEPEDTECPESPEVTQWPDLATTLAAIDGDFS